MPDLELPDGRIIQDIPEGLSKDQIAAKLIGSGILTGKEDWLNTQPSAEFSKKSTVQQGYEMAAPLRQQTKDLATLPYRLARGIGGGLGNALIGAAQAGTDIIAPDSGFSTRLKQQVGKLKEEQSKLSPAERFGIGVGETIPALAATKNMGLISGSTAGGGLAGLTSIQEEGGLENRGLESLKQGALGLAGGAATKAISAAVPSISNLVKRLNPFTEKAPEETLAKAIKPEEAAKLANKLEIRGERQGLLPDVAGDEVAGLTRLLAKTSGSKDIINRTLNNRTVSSSRRISNLINNNISADKYFGNLDDLIKARAETSGPLYKKAYEEGNNLLAVKGARKGTLDELIGDDRIVNAISQARKDFGIGKEVPDVSVEALHGARQKVDDIISAAYKAGENNKGRSYRELKDKINKVLYEASPTLKEADQTFAGFSALKNAQEAGLDFTKLRPEELKSYYSGLTSGEKDAFKIGVRENLMKSIERTNEGASSARKIFAKPENRAQLKIVFDNPKEYSDFSRKMLDEIRIFDTKNRILGGSRTDINLADEKELINKGIQFAKSPKLGVLNAISDSIKKSYLGISDENATQIARIITNKTKSIDALRKIANKASDKEREAINNLIQDKMRYLLTPAALAIRNTPDNLNQ